MNRVFIKVMVSLFFAFVAGVAFGQYPATGNKQRLGYQTTGDGLVWRGAIGDTTTIDPVGIANAWMLIDTATGFVYAYRGKRWQLVTSRAYMPLDSILFTTSNENTSVEGELTYNNQSGTLHLGMAGGIEMPVGQGEAHLVRNTTGTTIAKGKVVYIVGATGQRPLVALADADAEMSSSVTFGITAEAILDNDSGFVFTSGYIHGINTSTFTEGEAIWLSTTAGEFTHDKPTAPVHSVLVGYVITKKNNGTIFVKIQNGYELGELHDVSTQGAVAKDILRYNGTIWQPGNDTSVYNMNGTLKGNRTILTNNFQLLLRDSATAVDMVEMRSTYAGVKNTTTANFTTVDQYGIFHQNSIDNNNSEIYLSGGQIAMSGNTSTDNVGLDPDVVIDQAGRVKFRVSAGGTVDSLYGKNSSGQLTATVNNLSAKLNISDTAAMLANYVNIADTAAMLSSYLKTETPQELSASLAATNAAALELSGPPNAGEAIIVVDGNNATPWDGIAVVGIVLQYQSRVIFTGQGGILVSTGVSAYADTVKVEIPDNSITGEKTRFTGISGNASILLGVLTDGRTDTVGLGTTLAITNGVLNATGGGGGGSVTSVGLSVGTSGSDINITGVNPVTTIGTINLNIPTASATVRGAVAATDWDRFDKKIGANDTISLSNRINTKLNISDTTAMLSTYLKKADTLSLSNRINTKLNISDTTAMLSTYLKKADTLSLSNRINTKLNISDTTAMLSTYLKKADTLSLSNRINTKLNISDTTAMLSTYQKKITLTTTGTSGAATFSGNTLNVPNYSVTSTILRDSQRYYFSISMFRQKDTVTNNFENADFFVVPNDLNTFCIRTMTARAFSESGNVSIQLYVKGVLEATLSSIGSNAGVSLFPTNIPITSGDIISLKTTSLNGTLIGLTATIQVQKTCN